MTFAGDFDKIVGSHKQRFLDECSMKLAPVVCTDAVSGSIVITLVGERAAIDKAAAQIESEGLDLPSFGSLSVKITNSDASELEKEDEESMSVELGGTSNTMDLIVNAVVVLAVLIVLAKIVSCSCCKSRKQEEGLPLKKLEVKTIEMEGTHMKRTPSAAGSNGGAPVPSMTPAMSPWSPSDTEEVMKIIIDADTTEKEQAVE